MSEVEYTDDLGIWWSSLQAEDQDRVAAAVELLEEAGPSLGRLLRPSTMRVLFAFDPWRTAILLLGGDKSGRWEEWYVDAIPRADRLFDEHLGSLRSEGLSHDEQ